MGKDGRDGGCRACRPFLAAAGNRQTGGGNLHVGFTVDRVGPAFGYVDIDAEHIGQLAQQGAAHDAIARRELPPGDFHVDEGHSAPRTVDLPVPTKVTTRRSRVPID